MFISSSLFILATIISSFDLTLAYATYPRDGGVVITLPPPQNDTGLKAIPDAEHPFQAPGPDDQRGPCPGLNTMANHGYLPRNGIASFEQIIEAAGEAFNMDAGVAQTVVAFAMLARGNAFTNQLSIGGPSPLVPPLPGNIDGNVTKGLATHGRFEGDVSMTRADAAIGDNVHFNQTLFDEASNELLALVQQYGNDSDVTGPKSIVTVKAMSEFKHQRFVEDQKANIELQLHPGRFGASFAEASFTLNFFANGTDGTLSVPTMTSIFRNQTFPQNWHRRASPATFEILGATGTLVMANFTEVVPGANAPNGTYIPDTNITECSTYINLASENLPAVLMNTTGVLKQNVDFLLNIMHSGFSDGKCDFAPPIGPADT